MKARTVLIATVIAGLIGAVSLSAHQGWYGGGMMNMHGSSTQGVHSRGMMGMSPLHTPRGEMGACGDRTGFFLEQAEALSLTEEQIVSLKAIRSDYRKDVIQIGGRFRTLQVDIYDLLSEQEVPLSTLEEKIRQQGKLRTEQELAYVRALSKAREVLTTDQLNTLSAQPEWETASGSVLCHGQSTMEVEPSTSTTWNEDALIYP